MFYNLAKEKFEEWYCAKNKKKYSIYYLQKALTNFKVFSELEMLQMFYSSGLSIQIGVIEDFAFSLGYIIKIDPYADESCVLFIEYKNEDLCIDSFDTKDEARLEAINQLNEILNNS